jgi:hypothetical protein
MVRLLLQHYSYRTAVQSAEANPSQKPARRAGSTRRRWRQVPCPRRAPCPPLDEEREKQVVSKPQNDRAQDEGAQHDGDHPPAGNGHGARDGADGGPGAGDEEGERSSLTQARVHKSFYQRHGGLGVEVERDAQDRREGDAQGVPRPEGGPDPILRDQPVEQIPDERKGEEQRQQFPGGGKGLASKLFERDGLFYRNRIHVHHRERNGSARALRGELQRLRPGSHFGAGGLTLRPGRLIGYQPRLAFQPAFRFGEGGDPSPRQTEEDGSGEEGGGERPAEQPRAVEQLLGGGQRRGDHEGDDGRPGEGGSQHAENDGGRAARAEGRRDRQAGGHDHAAAPVAFEEGRHAVLIHPELERHADEHAQDQQGPQA